MRVLLVEDEATIADFIRKGLSERGYAVDLARDGEEALSMCSEVWHDSLIDSGAMTGNPRQQNMPNFWQHA